LIGAVFSLHATLLGLSAATASGVRVSIPAVCLVYGHRLGLVPLSENFEWLDTWPATSGLLALLLLELLADKIPAVDHVLHLLATPLHAAAGALVVVAPAGSFGAGSVGHATGTESMAVAAGVGAMAALIIHAAKAAARAVASAACCGAANCCVSLLEDISVFILMALAILFAVATVAIAAGCMLAVASALGYLLCGHADRHSHARGRYSQYEGAPVVMGTPVLLV
jgi:hypothetical protein